MTTPKRWTYLTGTGWSRQRIPDRMPRCPGYFVGDFGVVVKANRLLMSDACVLAADLTTAALWKIIMDVRGY